MSSSSAPAQQQQQSSLPRLGPAWKQRSPLVTNPGGASASGMVNTSSMQGQLSSNNRDRSASTGSAFSNSGTGVTGNGGGNANSFSALLMDGASDDEGNNNNSNNSNHHHHNHNSHSSNHHYNNHSGRPMDRAGSSSGGDRMPLRKGSIGSAVGTTNSRSDALLGGGSGSGRFSRSRTTDGSAWGSASSSNNSGKPGGGGGRSLADLAAQKPHTGMMGHRAGSLGHSSHHHSRIDGASGGGDSGGDTRSGSMDASSLYPSYRRRSDSGGAEQQPPEVQKKVTRFTRERLLAIRPDPSPDAVLPDVLVHLEGTVILAKEPQEPVCFDVDDFEPDTIWAQQKPHPRGSIGATTGSIGSKSPSNTRLIDPGGTSSVRGPVTNGGVGRWQRGIALPASSEDPNARGSGAATKATKELEVEDDLWDDPEVSTGAAIDFSQFGGSILNDEPPLAPSVEQSGAARVDYFDLDKMSEAAQRFEHEMHGPSDSSLGDAALTPSTVDPRKPLASAGTTIESGSGDHVNVFEDFGAPPSPVPSSSSETRVEGSAIGTSAKNNDVNKQPEQQALAKDSSAGMGSGVMNVDIKVNADVEASADIDASSRLMQMIGISSGTTSSASGVDSAGSKLVSPWGIASSVTSDIPFSNNPWGDTSTIPSAGALDLPARMESAMIDREALEKAERIASEKAEADKEEEQRLREQKAAEEQKQQQLLLQLQRQKEEEEAAVAAQQRQRETEEAALRAQEAEAQARQQQQQQEEAARAAAAAASRVQPSQVELVLMERITTILENSWGRADLMNVLTTLHRDDARVVPLLGNIEMLRTLILRHPSRIALTKDPAFGVDMAMLIMTNAQFLQQEQQMRQQQQEEELQRQRQQQQQQLQAQQAAALAHAEAQAEAANKAKAAASAQAAQTQTQEASVIVITDDPWYYADPQGHIQGPFGGDEMRQWLDGGYFKGDLPISQNPHGPFQLLSSLFSDWAVAFQPTPNPIEQQQRKEEMKLQEEAAAAAAAAVEEERRAQAVAATLLEEERLASEERALQARAVEDAQKQAQEKERLERLEKEKKEMEAAAETLEKNTSSAQLKMMLGLSGGPALQHHSQQQQQETLNSNNNISEATSKHENKQQQQPSAISKSKQSKTKNKKSQSSSSSIEKNPLPSSLPPPPLVHQVPQPAPPAPVAWGGAAATKTTVRKKSMSEIQQEEARVAARLQSQRQSIPRQSSGGWANVAASGKAAWSSGAVKSVGSTPLNSASSLAGVNGVGTGVANTNALQQIRVKQQQAQVAAAQKQVFVQHNQQQSQKAVDDFGARMSPSLENWCKDQLRKLAGGDDLTLVSFCMTLKDPEEIQQYLAAYLGSTPQVTSFATEFINRKNGGKGNTEEWETTGASKKGRKKKSGATR
mmetsp:Transcript_22589/g.27610  ORF Transcript_22589/g.27610 Transcript_22589/m.27610 type:complete len:1391 (-) Transcript_22589:215-4387(-)